ncbi:hypothetical protein ACFX4N_23815 [Priestia sp. YIM B13551]|uniref:hypothetical protein n=1 Tax=Priestia sp. YIM B13551 TaxID=3366306 RepID=UPI00366F96FA
MAEQQKPVVNKIKVDDTTHSYNESTETRTNPHVKTNVPDTKAASKFLKKNQRRIALGAVGVGLAKSVIDGEDDDLVSSTAKGLKTGALAAGLSYGAEHLLKTQTVQDLVKGEVLSESERVARDVRVRRKMIAGGGRAANALKIGLYAMGAATVLDVGQRAGDHLEAEELKRREERKFAERRKKQKQKNKQYSYGHIDQGEIVMDLFNARTGHYKMGNAKFN